MMTPRRELALAAALLAVALSQLALRRSERLPQEPCGEVRILDFKGEVDFQRTARATWCPAQRGCCLPAGSKICTGIDGEVLLACGTKGLVLIEEATCFDVRSFQREGSSLVLRGRVDPGEVRILVRPETSLALEIFIDHPRLTASVRSSGECVYANGDEVPDSLVEEGDDGRPLPFCSSVRSPSTPPHRHIVPPAPPYTPPIQPVSLTGRAKDDPRALELAHDFDRVLARSGPLARWGAACAEARSLMHRVAIERTRSPSK